MRKFLFLLVVAGLVHVSDNAKKIRTTRGPSWYDFWKEPARKVNTYLQHGYKRAVNFSENADEHKEQLWEGLRRLWFVFWFGTCPEKLKTHTTTTTTPTTPIVLTFPTHPRGRARAHALKMGKNETDYIPKKKKKKKPGKKPQKYFFGVWRKSGDGGDKVQGKAKILSLVT